MQLIDVIEIAGALLVLAGFAAAQAHRLDVHSLPYLIVNALGAGALAVVAAIHASWGFLLLEGTWAIVSVGALTARWRDRRPPSRRRRPRPDPARGTGAGG